MMELYYGTPEGEHIVLSEEEANHLLRVRRATTGETIHVTDGSGKLFITSIHNTGKRNCELKIISSQTFEPPRPSLHIAVAPTKNIDRMEWFVEKATENGVSRISFIICSHSERRELKPDRLRRVAIAAMKQSRKFFLPVIDPLLSFREFVDVSRSDIKLFCDTLAGPEKSFSAQYKKGKSLLAVIGPEGDFDNTEKEIAREKNFESVSLGKSVLRTETAAVNCSVLFNFLNY